MNLNHPPTRRFGRPGFSLVEIMVVVAIIFVLMGLSLIAMKRVTQSANVKQTRLLLNQMMSIEGEYRRTARQSINHYTKSSPPKDDYDYTRKPFDWTQNKPHNIDLPIGSTATIPPLVPNTDAHVNGSIEAFVWATLQLPACDQMYSGLRADRSLRDGDLDASPVRDPDGFYEVVDHWGTPIRYYLRNVDENLYPSGDIERDTFATTVFRFHAKPFFVSAGPDGKWGDLNGSATERKEAEDNIYSFDLE